MKKSTEEQAEELIADFIQMQPRYLDKIGVSMNQQYEYAKAQAQYCANRTKHSHEQESEEFAYWRKVELDIIFL